MRGKPFTKNDSRINKEGRPTGSKNLTTKVREALEKIAEGENYTYEEALIKSILKKAIVDGDASTQKLVWQYLDGMPTQKIEQPEKLKVYCWGEPEKPEQDKDDQENSQEDMGT